MKPSPSSPSSSPLSFMANPINDDAAGDPHSGFTTRGHEAERTADGSIDFGSDEDDEIDRYK